MELKGPRSKQSRSSSELDSTETLPLCGRVRSLGSNTVNQEAPKKLGILKNGSSRNLGNLDYRKARTLSTKISFSGVEKISYGSNESPNKSDGEL